MSQHEFNEFELLTIRECLFKCRHEGFFNEDEFEEIDKKIKHLVEKI